MLCKDDATQHAWKLNADASSTAVDDPRGLARFDAHGYLLEEKLKETVKQISQSIQFPIYVKVKKMSMLMPRRILRHTAICVEIT